MSQNPQGVRKKRRRDDEDEEFVPLERDEEAPMRRASSASGGVRRGNREGVFVGKDNNPIPFFIHKSIRNQDKLRNLKKLIRENGGQIVSNDLYADTVLVDTAYPGKEALQSSFNNSDNPNNWKIWVEYMTFVRHCIGYNTFEHTMIKRKGMGGKVGNPRRPFTEEEERKLARYLSRQMPDLAGGGRLGDKVYAQLYASGHESEEFRWALAHPPLSWKERYKKNRERFDEMIAHYAAKETHLEKQLWPEDRRLAKGRRRMIEEPGEEQEEETSEEEQQTDGSENEEGIQQPDSMDEDDWENYDPDAFERVEEDVLEQPAVESEPEDRIDFRTGVTTKKRRRSDMGVPQSTQPNKKAKRSRPTGGARDDSPVQQSRSKGKERAIEVDEDEDLHNTSLFSINPDEVQFEDLPIFDAPGPSQTLPSPDRTLAEPGPSRSRRSENHPMFLTQDTLVNPASPNRMDDFHPTSHSTSANRRHSANTTRSQVATKEFTSKRQSVAPRSPPPPPPAQPRRSTVFVDIPVVRKAKTYPAKPAPKPRPKLAARRPRPSPPPEPVVAEAPYRNTRSRSRSVEPAIVAAVPKTKRVKKKETIPEEVEVEVEVEEEPVVQEVASNPPVTETIEEEIDVENILIAQDANQSLTTSERAREASLETDDAQTRQDLLQELPKVSTPKKTRADQLRALTARLSVPSPLKRPMAQNNFNKARRSDLGSIRGAQEDVVVWKEPRTPVAAASRSRAPSNSSVESFPLDGTKAKEESRKRAEQDKKRTFTPLTGTKADKFLSASKQRG